MHKKGITEEVAKKRSRKTVKHQRGIVGADLAAIAAKRNQSLQVRTAQRAAAIQKAKADKKAKEEKKDKKVRLTCPFHVWLVLTRCMRSSPHGHLLPAAPRYRKRR